MLQEATNVEFALDDFDDSLALPALTPPALDDREDSSTTAAPGKTPGQPPISPDPGPTASEPPHSSHHPYRLKRKADDPKSLDNARRKRKRATKIEQNGHQPHPRTVQKVIQKTAPAFVSADFAHFPAAAGAYQAKIFRPLAADIPHSAASLSLQGFEYLPWNGT